MKNIPVVKLGIIAVSRDCFPMSLSATRRGKVCEEYKKYGEIYECKITVENEKDAMKAKIGRVQDCGLQRSRGIPGQLRPRNQRDYCRQVL